VLNTIVAPFNNHNDIKRAAQRFLRKYHPEDTLPIPIEEIIEFQLHIDIIPIPGLHELINSDGFLASDLKSISVDKYALEKRLNRYRFTLAHEIGHSVLHKDLLRQNRFATATKWKSFVSNLPPQQYVWFEWQAYEFAGLVLAPPKHLKKRFEYNSKKIRSHKVKCQTVIKEWATELSAKDFLVSTEVIRRRLLKDGLVPNP